MKNLIKVFPLILILTSVSFISNAQRFAYIDSEYILDKIPEYRSAQKQLENYAENWKGEIENRIAEIDKMYKEYQAEKVLLPETEKKKREETIMKKEKELNEFKKQKFGPEGELYVKRKELIKPVQDKVFDAVQEIAKEESLDFIFDKAGAVTMLYTNAKYDRSNEVLEALGVNVEDKK